MEVTTRRPHFACPKCGSEEVGAWQRQYVLRDVTGWTESGEPERCRPGALNYESDGFAAPPGYAGRCICDCGHEFDTPKRVED